MAVYIKFLKYLKRQKADLNAIEVANQLQELGFTDEEQMLSILNSLQNKGYISYTDTTEKGSFYHDDIAYIYCRIPGAPVRYEVRLTADGVEHLETKNSSYQDKIIALIGLVISIVGLVKCSN